MRRTARIPAILDSISSARARWSKEDGGRQRTTSVTDRQGASAAHACYKVP